MFKLLYKKTTYLFLFLFIIFLVSFYLTQYLHNITHQAGVEADKLSEQIDIQSVKMSSAIHPAEILINNYPNNYWQKLDSLFKQDNYICFVTTNDSVHYWNSNKVNILNFSELITDNNIHVASLPSGIYLYTAKNIGTKKIYLLELIRADFKVNNSMLTPEFNSVYSNSHNLRIVLDSNSASYSIYNNNGEYLLGTHNSTNEETFNNTHFYSLFLFLLSYIFLMLFLLSMLYGSSLYKKSPLLSFSIFIITILILRITDFLFQFPEQLKLSSYFSSTIYNIPFTNGIGDILINTLILIIIAIAAHHFFRKKSFSYSSVIILLKYTSLTLFSLVIFFILFQANYDHELSFLSENLFKNEKLFILTAVVIGLNISLYYVFITYLNSTKENKVPFFIPFIITLSLISIFFLLTDIPVILLIITILIISFLIIIKLFFWKNTADRFLNHLMLLVLLSIVSSVIISSSYKLKNDRYQKYISQTMAITNDTVFEESYKSIMHDIIEDKYISQIAFTDSITTDELLEAYIQSTYFTGYLNKYDIQITNCGKNELLEIQPEGEVYDCSDYFNSLINQFTIPVIDSVLFHFNSTGESVYYLGQITIIHPTDKNKHRTLFVEFVSSHVPEGLGYAELLIDKSVNTLNLSQFSFAIYSNNHLNYKFGDFAYNTYLSFNKNFQLNAFFDYENYRHFAVRISDNNYLIVSREETRTTMKIVSFSIIFILLSIISILTYIIVYARKAFYLFRLNFKTRLQTFVIASLTLTFVLMAISTLIYIEDSSRKELEKQLTEKSNSVLIELQHKLSSVTNLQSQDSEFLHQLLRKFSLVFFSDINLYDETGHLIATSRPEIFEKSLLSSYINPEAFSAIFKENKLNFITEEKIGAMKYYSAYVPINLNNDYPIGIVNLPYFARQTEFTKSYYIMLSYLLNIYVIIGIIGTLIAIIFSRYLTRPLVLLQRNIAAIRIDKHNERIQWNKNDEIGMLIHEYNRMVDKLEQSAELLVRSERESAWREVARQIAHEIKNPLTPMKLNVQYLEKSYKNNDPDFSTKMESISKSLVTQIDTLDNVAEMFSDFAKSKSFDFIKIDLKKIIVSSVNLFDKNSNVSVSINFEDSKSECMILGFEKDILRVINNILKNAVQSVDKNINCKIDINVKHDTKFIVVAISDNGRGISEEMKSKIFQPYFTTKTSGTGLGLAIVKNIMNEIGGMVSFKSGKNKGTTFYLNFPNAI